MIRTYDDLTEAEKSELSKAWATVAEALYVYERITGADIVDLTYDELWENVQYQKDEEARDE